ncbi:MAG: DUF2304 domain-containing protein [Chloroflexi bacterium]|nr:MAG: DUF2304 domain-containing protein [Chloroflexota bacterium]
MPPGIQLIALAFALFMAYLTYVDFRRRRFGVAALGFWAIVWGGLAVVSLVPALFVQLSQALRLARPMDLAVVLGMLILSGATYHNFASIHTANRQLERLVREIALSKLEGNQPPTRPRPDPSASDVEIHG